MKAAEPMVVTPDGIVTDVRPVAVLKALLPMLVTKSGITNAPVRPVLLKASAPMLVNLDPAPKVTVARLVAP